MHKKFFLLFIGLMTALVILATRVGVISQPNEMDAAVLRAGVKIPVATLAHVEVEQPVVVALPEIDAQSVFCEYAPQEKVEYKATFIEARKKLKVDTGEKFRVKVFMKNTGNTPWFSAESGCEGPIVNLGTDLERDHDSTFYSPKIKEEDNNWIGPNRVGLDQLRVDPEEVASFTFWVEAGDEPDIYKEFMTPVVEGITWIDDAGFSFETLIGDTGEDAETTLTRRMLMGESGSAMSVDLNGEKKIKVDLSEQKMHVYLGDHLVREFTVSTGAPKTPTPVGTHTISLKQEVRIGGKSPHYVMPNFMMFRKDGYGIHALPSLSRKGGDVFWTEARDHIGRPVSHGCIRVLPEDSDFVFAFADIGTTVEVQR